jgi:GNAT superfamily N-acetyltransferase
MAQSATLDAPSLSPVAPRDGTETYALHVASGREWEREIDDLRIASYRTAGYFKLPDPDTVRRRTDPDDSLCLLLRQGPVLAATVRLAYVRDRAAAEAVLQGPVPLDTDDFPSITLCRGATDPRHRGRGLMSLLVAAGVAIAHRAGLRSAIGMQADGTPHYREMTRAGWRSRDVATRFARSVSFETPTMKLVHLHRAAMPQSIEHSNRRHAQTLAPSRAEPAIERSAVLLGRMARP